MSVGKNWLSTLSCVGLLAVASGLATPSAALAQRVTYAPGSYFSSPSGMQYNPQTGSVYRPGVGVMKPHGTYNPIGSGYYQNPWTGNIYNPNSGAYIQPGYPNYGSMHPRHPGPMQGPLYPAQYRGSR